MSISQPSLYHLFIHLHSVAAAFIMVPVACQYGFFLGKFGLNVLNESRINAGNRLCQITGFTGTPITDSRATVVLAVSHTEQTFVFIVHNDEHVYLAHFATICFDFFC